MSTALQTLAQVNRFGAPFLLAYGMTWIVCGFLWRKIRPSYAAIATLFQGMVALPIALVILYFIDAFDHRPAIGEINQLSLLLSMSQILIIPLLIAMFRKKHYTLVPFVFSGAGAVHFLLYAWLYQTPIYILMSLLIAVVIAFVYGTDRENAFISKAAAAKASLFTGMILLLAGSYFVLIS